MCFLDCSSTYKEAQICPTQALPLRKKIDLRMFLTLNLLNHKLIKQKHI